MIRPAKVRKKTAKFRASGETPDARVTLSKCILIVDDSDNLRNSLRKFLERELGLTVCGEAVDGLDALEKVAHLSPDLSSWIW